MRVKLYSIPNIAKIYAGYSIPTSFLPEKGSTREKLIKELDTFIGEGKFSDQDRWAKAAALQILQKIGMDRQDKNLGWFVNVAIWLATKLRTGEGLEKEVVDSNKLLEVDTSFARDSLKAKTQKIIR